MTPADMLLHIARRIAPIERRDWLNAMDAEYQTLRTGRLRWALGCVGVSLGWRLAKDGVYAALVCAAIWFLCANPLFAYEAKYISVEFSSIGVFMSPIYMSVFCLLLSAYRPGRVALTGTMIVLIVNLHRFYVWYFVFPFVEPEQFSFHPGPLWPFLQDYHIYNARFLIGIWAELGACLTGGLLGRAIAHRFRNKSGAGQVMRR